MQKRIHDLETKLNTPGDNRMRYFNLAMAGSRTSSQNGGTNSSGLGSRATSQNGSVKGSGDLQERGQGKRLQNDELRNSKKEVKKLYIEASSDKELHCLFCGRTADISKKLVISMAHIVSSGADDYSDFGPKNQYPDEMNPFSRRNLLPLCVTSGFMIDGKRSCHSLYDAHMAVLIYNPFESKYDVHLLGDGNQISVSPTSMSIPSECTPYHRLLTWRAKKCLLEYSLKGEHSDILDETIKTLEVKVQLNEGMITGPFGSSLASSISNKNESVDS